MMHIDGIGIGPRQFLGDGRHLTRALAHLIIPFQPVAFDRPAVHVQREARLEKGEFFADAADIDSVQMHLKPRQQPDMNRQMLIWRLLTELHLKTI